MVKKFYYGLVSLKYSYFMFGIPLIIFMIAFMMTKKKTPGLKIAIGICAIALLLILVIYYRDKHRVRKALKEVKNIEEYETGGMMDCTYILKTRILACYDLKVQEVYIKNIQILEKDGETKKGRIVLKAETTEGDVRMSARSMEEAQRFVAFLKHENSNVELKNITPRGKGTLKELGGTTD